MENQPEIQPAKSLLKLPCGIQTFEEIRTEGYVYVDKTRFLVEMIDGGKPYFLARPRRFGKSLTCSTLEALFQGRKELFKGLYAEEFLNRSDFKPSPVIRLDMSEVKTKRGIDRLEKSVSQIVRESAKKLEVRLPRDAEPEELLRNLIAGAAEKYKAKTVILIDEYDKPYTDYFPDREKAEEVRGFLRGFYTQIKASDEYLRFVFLTGISKFTKMGVFSTINNLGDISILPQYAEICGYTERELIANFTPHLEVLAKKENLSVNKLVEKLRYRYDGFSFDGNVRLYNPFSMLHVLRDQQFDDFWIDTGMSETLVNYVKDKHLTVEEFRNFPYSRSQARNPGEMDSAPPESFLYQSGYLTLRKGTGEDFVLDYPNTEVLNAMSALVSRCLIGDREANNISNFLKKGFETGDKESLVGAFSKIIAGIPYDDYTKAAECEMFCVNPKMGPREWLYRTSLLCFLRGAGMWVDAEVHSSHGRSDIVARNALGKTLVVEIKIAQNATDVPAKLAEALAQIETRHYAAQFPNAQTLALVIDDEKRKVGAWE